MGERIGKILLNEFILSPSEEGNDSRLLKVFLRNDLEFKSWHLVHFEESISEQNPYINGSD